MLNNLPEFCFSTNEMDDEVVIAFSVVKMGTGYVMTID